MEGRAIARPNPYRAEADGDPVVGSASLQWRAEQLPGQTEMHWYRDPAGRSTPGFNGGPSNCPAKPRCNKLRGCIRPRLLACASMEGRAIARPNRVMLRYRGRPWLQRIVSLQWRAEQLPGQTSNVSLHKACGRAVEDASMEGRAIARPNMDSEPHQLLSDHQLRLASMEGRAIARPNMSGSSSTPRLGRPKGASMEGRAIARPNRASFRTDDKSTPGPSFNGGPSNCPAKPIQRPDAGTRPNGASMEGRAIARPNTASPVATVPETSRH